MKNATTTCTTCGATHDSGIEETVTECPECPAHHNRLPAYTTSEQTYQAFTALAAVVAREAAIRIQEQTMAAWDAWDCLCLAVEAIASNYPNAIL